MSNVNIVVATWYKSVGSVGGCRARRTMDDKITWYANGARRVVTRANESYRVRGERSMGVNDAR